MDSIKGYFKRSLIMMIFFMLLLLGVAVAAHYPELEQFKDVYTMTYVVVFVLLYTLLQWMFLRNSLIKALRKVEPPKATKSSKKFIKTELAPTAKELERKDSERRREFLHLFSVLQREGRLMDFLSEELDDYEDDQIGAAVRNIHASCKKTITKYIHPKAIVSQEEGSTIEIPAGFDPATIKLIGNVVGDPPFKGVVRHRGWQAKKFELPLLSESSSPLIIAPAEVEVE